MNGGVIQQVDTPDRVYEAPGNAFVAQFIGENNRLGGRIAEVNGETCVVHLDGGAAVRALAVNIAGAGARTTVSLRPERVRIGHAATICPNCFEGQVQELIYFGDHTRVRLAVGGRDDFIVKLAHTDGPPQIHPGENILVGFRTEDCRALDAD
jgi:putative spermidine/putrescine transport system ATP-binding protein